MAAVLTLIKSLNEGDLERVRDLLTEDSELRIPASGTHLVGRGSFTRRSQARSPAWSDVEIQVTNVLHDAQQLAVEALVTGTHSGEWTTGIPEVGTLAGTGRRVTRASCYVVALQDGHVSRLTAYYDRMALVQQLLH